MLRRNAYFTPNKLHEIMTFAELKRRQPPKMYDTKYEYLLMNWTENNIKWDVSVDVL